MAKKINRGGRGGSQRVVIFLCVLCGFPDRPENNKKSLNYRAKFCLMRTIVNIPDLNTRVHEAVYMTKLVRENMEIYNATITRIDG